MELVVFLLIILFYILFGVSWSHFLSTNDRKLGFLKICYRCKHGTYIHNGDGLSRGHIVCHKDKFNKMRDDTCEKYEKL